MLPKALWSCCMLVPTTPQEWTPPLMSGRASSRLCSRGTCCPSSTLHTRCAFALPLPAYAAVLTGHPCIRQAWCCHVLMCGCPTAWCSLCGSSCVAAHTMLAASPGWDTCTAFYGSMPLFIPHACTLVCIGHQAKYASPGDRLNRVQDSGAAVIRA